MKRGRGEYGSSGVSEETKEAIAWLAKNAVEAGVPLDTVVAWGKGSRYEPKRRTLQLHISRLKRGLPLFKEEKETGAPKLLDAEELEVLWGAILVSEKKVDLKAIQDLAHDLFGVELSKPTAQRYAKEGELGFNLLGARPLPPRTTWGNYVQLYYQCVLDLHNSGFFKAPPSLIACIDSASNSRRLQREKSYQPVGTPQKKIARSAFKYTDLYIVCKWLDGIERTPTLFVTYNPQFDPDGPCRADVNKWLKENRISRNRIFYIKSDKNYCAETADNISNWVRIYKAALKGAHVLRDNGPAYKKNGVDLIAQYAARVETLEPVTHGETSVIDRYVNSVAKAAWVTKRVPDAPEWVDALNLLLEYDKVDSRAIKSMWANNFLLDRKRLTIQAVEDQLRNTQKVETPRDRRHAQYKAAYHAHMEAKEGGEGSN
jgi:hypothetical protein